MILATSWSDPLALATFLLALATGVLGLFTWRSVTAATRVAKAAEEDVKVARDSLSRAERPVLADVPKKKYPLYGLDSSLPKVFVGDDYTEVEVPLQNIGQGAALILNRNPAPIIQFMPDKAWYVGEVDVLVLPGGEATIFRAHINIVPKPDNAGRLTIYCGVPYTDLRNGQRQMTYLCLMRDHESDDLEHHDIWSVHGVAVEQGEEFVHSGEGWEQFERYT